MSRPHPLVVRALLLRGLHAWVAARVVLACVQLFGAAGVDLAPTAALFMVAVSTGMGLADVHRRHERTFLGNLGVSTRMVVALLAPPALLGEVVVAMLLRLA